MTGKYRQYGISCAVEKIRRKGNDLQLGCRYGYIYLVGTSVPTQQGRYMRYVATSWYRDKRKGEKRR